MGKPDTYSIITNKIEKNVKKRVKWNCLTVGCKNTSIKSHLLQQNGILNNISTDDNHLIEMRMVDYVKSQRAMVELKKIGIKQAISLPLFCSSCDTNIFKPIESSVFDTSEYKTQLLFSYRSLCSELRKQQISQLFKERCLNASTLRGLLDRNIMNESLRNTRNSIKGLELNKSKFESELTSEKGIFTFKTYYYPLIEVYGSATFSPTNFTFSLYQTPDNFKNIYINIIPEQSRLTIIVGYANHASNKWTEEYVDSWSNLSKIGLEQKLTELFATRIETWGLSEELFKKINRKNIKKFIDHWRDKGNDFSYYQKVDFNLFEINSI